MDFRVYSVFLLEFVTLFIITNALSPDGLALLDFKSSLTNGAASITSDWKDTDSSPCSWGGVTCSSSGLVIDLNLSSRGIAGAISPSLGKLQSLQILDISSNLLQGPIPPELGNCSSLLILSVGNNNLNGTIPTSLGSLQSLKRLILTVNSLGGEIPPEVGNLGNLTYLDMSGNFFNDTVPKGFGNLLQLEEIFLDYNNFGGSIPEEFLALPKLQYVDLSYNQFSGVLPLVIFNNTNLIDLRITNNNLTGDLSSALEALAMNPVMWYFDCSNNQFNGTIPQTLGNMTSLFLFYINSNMFTGPIPPSVGKLTHLTWLNVYANQLTGPIPSEIGNLKELVYFVGSNNLFSGLIPAEFGDCIALQTLLLANNSFTEGKFLPSLSKLTNLTSLDLSSTSLIGDIPLGFYNMTLLQVVILSYNNLTGSILPEIGNLEDLYWIDVGHNFLSGFIPNEIEKCTSMQIFDVTTNNFQGVIPINYWNFKHLTFTAGSLNQWSPGPFPPALAESVNLTWISFYGVSFNGSLPLSLGMTSQLEYLSLHGSSLSGNIPDGLCVNNTLAYLDLSNNEFEGAIPTSLAKCTSLGTFLVNNNWLTTLPVGFVTNLTSLTSFDISFNQFGGPLSMNFGAHPNLLTLYLNNNNFSGNLSSLEFGQVSNLLTLYLSNNQFSGNLLAFKFGQVSSLLRLNLSTNSLTGPIPTSIASCADLTELDLSINYLIGDISSLAKVTKLQNLCLQGNMFSRFDGLLFNQLLDLTNLDLASNVWNTSIPSEIGGLLDLQSLNMSYGQLLGPIPSTFETLRNLEVLDLSHNELEGTIPIELGNLLSLYSVNISFNNLTGSLPVNWVRLLEEDPNDFVENPWLCQNYSASLLQCLNVMAPLPSKDGDRSISNRTLIAIVICMTLMLIMVVGMFGWWYFLLRTKFHKRLGKAPIFFTTMVGEEIKFSDVMEAIDNMSDNFLLKKNLNGAIYKGLLKSDKTIILKTIEIANDAVQSIQSYLAEIEILQNVKHRNIVKLLGFCKWNNIGLILYDYIPNGDLDNALHGIETSIMLDWQTRLHIAKGVAHGMAYLHHYCATPIIHRDIKASNVLLDKHLEPLLSDFGIARVMATKTKDGSIESTTLVAGTYGYMAPEYVSGAKISPKADVYSYGVLLLELLTGRRPIDKTFGNLLHIVLYVRQWLQKNTLSLSEVIDSNFIAASKYEQNQMLEVLNMALFCTKDNPNDRPSSKEVEDMLCRCSIEDSGIYCN